MKKNIKHFYNHPAYILCGLLLYMFISCTPKQNTCKLPILGHPFLDGRQSAPV